MSLCKCCNCGKLFEDEDAIREEEPRGEYWGVPCTETMYYSPCCHDDFEDYIEETDLWICEDCGKIWSDKEVDKEKVKGFGSEWEIERRCPDCLGEVNPYVE